MYRMNKTVLLISLVVLTFFSCSSDDPAAEIPDKGKPEQPEVPNEPEIKVEATIMLDDTIYNGKSTAISLDTKNEFEKVEYYFEGELIGTSIGSGYKINWTPKDVNGGIHEIQVVCALSKKEYKFSNSTILKLLIGEEYKGGIIVFIERSGDKGIIVSKTDLSGGEMNGEFEWGVKGALIGANSANGKENTDKIIAAYSDSKYSIAAFLQNGVNISGYKDWYIPSKEEFSYIENNKELVPNLNLDEKYWTSSEKDKDNAHFGHFSGTMMGTGSRKDWFRPVRLVRSF